MKTKAMTHQLVGEERLLKAEEYYALGAEQGTGKTWMILNDAEHQWRKKRITGLLIIAPKGVHTNWMCREIPLHLSIPHRPGFWLAGAGKKHTRQLHKLLEEEEEALTIVAMNVDAVNSKPGYAYAQAFLKAHRCMMTVDESQRIKNPAAKRTKRVIELGQLAYSKRICSGTLVANSPLDLFSQFEFLHPGLLGTTSYRAFVSEYAELLPAGHPLLQNIRGNPQIIAKDVNNRPLFKNLEKLQTFIAPHTFRVLKSECLDLPEKIYQTHFFELSPSQMAHYRELQNTKRQEYNDGGMDTFTALTLIGKLRQVTSGFILRDGEPVALTEHAARIQALNTILEDTEGKVIIWASFREEIAQIANALRDTYECVQYHGGITQKDRECAVDSFQNGSTDIFIGHPAAGGTGLTLHAAQAVIYYSCSYSLEQRLQSEDRAHRIGTRHNVVYTDLVARDTIDERIAAALQMKTDIALEILSGLM